MLSGFICLRNVELLRHCERLQLLIYPNMPRELQEAAESSAQCQSRHLQLSSKLVSDQDQVKVRTCGEARNPSFIMAR